MLNIDTIKNGLVIDHIKAGTGWRIFQWLGLDTSPFSAALIMNVVSRKSGKNKGIYRCEYCDTLYKAGENDARLG